MLKLPHDHMYNNSIMLTKQKSKIISWQNITSGFETNKLQSLYEIPVSSLISQPVKNTVKLICSSRETFCLYSM